MAHEESTTQPADEGPVERPVRPGSEARGTFACPICKAETPHGHSAEQINAYSKTRTLDHRVKEMLESEFEQARAALQDFDAACPTCRSVRNGYVMRTVGSANPFDMGMRRDGERLYCPSCKRCVYDDA